MSVITLIASSEKVITANHPFGFTDTKNRAILELFAAFGAEHIDSTGRHTKQQYVLVGEEGTYAGNNTAKTISLSNSNITPYLLVIAPDDTDYYVWKTNTMPSDESAEAFAWNSGGPITGMQDGQFSIDATNDLNETGVDYYYCVFGVDVGSTYIGDVGAGSDPTWLEDGDAIYGDGTISSPGNQVDAHIDAAFTHEHTDAGVHSPDPYSGKARIESLIYTGDGNDDRNILLSLNDLDIKFILIIKDNGTTTSITLRTETMTGDNTKTENASIGFDTNKIQSISTNGQFQLGDSAVVNESAITYYYIAIGE